ncbi:hypothetical protein T4C_6996 [Trichinella pseudospiralis]|uniref:C2H2-type domain-containing protein n=1 Tax=Trichinella pseudospiralis TaxID=6337 RepID=A0A0V1J592_TRIPS|nr:hypothetical protein T4C_6996 [Trichinella pseudospiralis]
MENAYLDSITSIEQLANLKVSQGQAKACCEDMPSSATIVRGTCSGSARSNHEWCRKRFDSELQLMEHANTYSGGLKPYMCEEDGCQRAYCGSVLSEQLCFKISTQGPGKILKTKKACYDHELLAQGNFKCGICGKGFGSRASWKCIRKELRKHLAVGPPLLLECAVSGNTVF